MCSSRAIPSIRRSRSRLAPLPVAPPFLPSHPVFGAPDQAIILTPSDGAESQLLEHSHRSDVGGTGNSRDAIQIDHLERILDPKIF
jgi:hypothetical protein